MPLGEDVTPGKFRRDPLEEGNSYQNLLSLLDKSRRLGEGISESSYCFNLLAEELRKMSGATSVAINTYDLHLRQSFTRAAACPEWLKEKIINVVGFDPVERQWPFRYSSLQNVDMNKVIPYTDLIGGQGGEIPESLVLAVRNALDGGLLYVNVIASGSNPVGELYFLMPPGKEVLNKEIIEIFSGQLGVLISSLMEKEFFQRERKKLDDIIEASAIGTWEWHIQSGEINYSKTWAQILGYKLDDLKSVDENTWRRMLHPDDLPKAEEAIYSHIRGDNSEYTAEYRMKHKNGTWVWIHDRGKIISHDSNGKPLLMFGTHLDITERKRVEVESQNNERRLQALVDLSQREYDSIQQLLDDSLKRALEICDSKYGYIYLYDESKEEFILNSWSKGVMDDCEVVNPQTRYELSKTGIWGEVVRQRKPILVNDFQSYNPFKKGYPAGHVELHRYLSVPVFSNGDIEAVVGVANKEEEYNNRDLLQLNLLMDYVWKIVMRKRAEQNINFISFHDQLTGLYNRHYFENELQRLERSREFPVALISADLNGLKLINDTFGHKEGDRYLQECSSLFRSSLRGGERLARIGGDEFAVIMPQTGAAEALEIVKRIRTRIDEHNRSRSDELPISISIGLSVCEKSENNLHDSLQEADDLMYRDKLVNGVFARNQILKYIKLALYKKDLFYTGHEQRLADLAEGMAKKIGADERVKANLVQLSKLHDLGKVGLEDQILFKPGPLTPDERAQVEKHPEKGYRLANSYNELADVAELILKHHEHWDGGGYPLGLKGREIPIECRILLIADAYDAMVNERPYRKAMSHEDALDEIKKHSGSQFDPWLVEIFLSMLPDYISRLA